MSGRKELIHGIPMFLDQLIETLSVEHTIGTTHSGTAVSDAAYLIEVRAECVT
jgi:hypothetical protein